MDSGMSLRDCYRDLAFSSLDSAENLPLFEKQVTLATTRNFVVDFDKAEAFCGFDLKSEGVTNILEAQRHSQQTRWINIWGPHEQVDIVKNLSSRYEFSPRLSGLMCSPLSIAHVKKVEANRSRRSHYFRHAQDVRHNRSPADVEKTSHEGVDSDRPKPDSLQSLNFYDVADRLWHWSSIDLGSKYVCLGYNTLQNAHSSEVAESTSTADFDLPKGQRQWTWLILCHDRTIITIFEHTFLNLAVNIRPQELGLSTIRGNLLNVFRQLSKAYKPTVHSAFSICPVRFSLDTDKVESSQDNHDAPGLLFYYLLDDWHSSWSLIAREEHQYGAELNQLRHAMSEKADLKHIETLHRIGRQLSVLKRLYESYIIIIDRLLEKRTAKIPTSEAIFPASQPFITNDSLDQISIYLSTAAYVRFQRLRDRIKLYVLSEIQECIDHKESLVAMNYNLIQIKESNSVERLTRITILLAKATILFLPVSLMTGYFSIQTQQKFTTTSYWICFAVILCVSFIVILVFGSISGTVEGRMVYQPFYQAVPEAFKRLVGRMKTRSN